MRKVALKIARYLSIDSEKGVTAIEYGLLASLIAVVIIVSVTAVGTQLKAAFTGHRNRADTCGRITALSPAALHGAGSYVGTFCAQRRYRLGASWAPLCYQGYS